MREYGRVRVSEKLYFRERFLLRKRKQTDFLF